METMTFSPAPGPAVPPVPATTPDAPPSEAVAAAGRGSRLRRLWRGPEQDPAWGRPALLGLLAATALLYLWDLTASGWANAFYSAAAQAGSESWKAFFYGSFDASSAITVDKPPAALWAMALSVRVLGLSSFAILLPQALMGVATVGVVFASVRRWFGPGAGLLAAAAMALTPVAVLMFRFDNPDALLTLVLALAAYATLRAVETGSVRWMVLTGALVGLGFLTKTLQAMLVVPFLGLTFLVLAATTLRRRVLGSLAAVAALVVSAGWWVAVVELVPASMRPYIGGSQTNSFLELTFGYNGLGRLNGEETGSVGGGGPNSGTGSLLRMFSSSVGDQVSWLLPAALVLLVAGLWLRGRSPRTDGRRAAYVVWGGWLLTTGLTFSLMEGIFHEYYTVALAPAIAALVGMGAAEAWERRERLAPRVVLAVTVAATAAWSFVLLTRASAYGDWLRASVLALGVASALLLLALGRVHRYAVPVAAGAALVAALVGPAAYSLSTVTTPHTGSIVTAGPGRSGGGPGGAFPGGARPGGTNAPGGALPGATGGRLGGMGGLLDATTPGTEVVAALSTDAAEYTWVAATVGSQNAAGLQLATQLPVMAIGGFNGSDPSPTLAQFQAYVADGRIHWFLGGGGFRGQNGGSSAASEIATWVQEGFTAVQLDGQTFYDLTKPLGAASSGTSATGQSA